MKIGKKEFVEKLMETEQFTSKKAAEQALTAVLDIIETSVAAGDEVTFVGFGTFASKKRNARSGVNPATGKKIKIKATVVPSFKAGKAFKDAVAK